MQAGVRGRGSPVEAENQFLKQFRYNMGIWTRKKASELAAHTLSENQALKRVLGANDLVMLGIGAVIGAGLFSLSGIAAAENAGPAITISFLIAALAAALAGLCYSELASMLPISGSAYTYSYATLGELVAWMMGWDLILEYAIGAATVSISWSAYVVSFLHHWNIHLPVELAASPWQSVRLPDGSLEYGWINLPALLIVMFISSILVIGVKLSSIFNAFIVTIKIAVILIFVILGFFYLSPENYHPYIPPNTGEYGSFGWSGILRGAAVLFFAYIGFDAVSTAAQETKNPQRNLPIGILGSLAICTALYVLFGFVLTGLVNFKELRHAAPVSIAVGRIPYGWVGELIQLAIIAGLTSVILVMLLGQSRIFYSMSRDGLLPNWFSDIHPKFHTPWRSSLLLMIFVGLIGAFAPISAVGHMTSIGTLLAFTVVCLAVIILRYTDPKLPRHFKTPFFPYVPLLGIAVCLIMMASLGQDAWLRLLVWLVLGLIIYFLRHRSKSFT
jgi:APA family basic amino acid/polyamine antiporter